MDIICICRYQKVFLILEFDKKNIIQIIQILFLQNPRTYTITLIYYQWIKKKINFKMKSFIMNTLEFSDMSGIVFHLPCGNFCQYTYNLYIIPIIYDTSDLCIDE